MNHIKEFLKTTTGKIVAVAVPVALIAIAVIVFLFLPGKEQGFRTISIAALQGTAKAEHNNKTYDAYINMVLKEGYSLTTEKDSFVRMLLDQDKYIKLEENSKASFTTLGKNNDGYTVIYLEYGAITNELAQSLSEEEDYIINTPNAVLAVRGTFFRVEVAKNSQGETLTDVYTYGGVVKSQRVLPSGAVIEEDVTIDGGYKATISMDTNDTIYVTESLEEGKENVEPIVLSEIPEADIVDMYVASLNGHEMYLPTEEIWENIEEREINIEDYRSNRDGSEIPKYELETESETKPESETNTEPQHTHSVVTITLDATCTENGYVRTVCSECNEILSETTISAVGHTEQTTTIPATGEFPSKVVVSCSVCETILSEVEVEEGHVHTEETITIEPTCTSAGGVRIQCSVCHEIISEVVEPSLGHTPETIIVEATCAAEGSKTLQCAVCNSHISTEVIPKLEHTTEYETLEATLGSAGYYKEWCTVCQEVVTEIIYDPLDALYTDEGSIYITSTGYYTTAHPTLVPFTGNYTISQKNPTPVECDIYVEGGDHFITLDNVNIKGVFDISADAKVYLNGSERLNTIESPSGVAAINNQATLQIESGHYVCFSSGNGLKNSGTLSITGGSLELTGTTADMKGNPIYITGGSIRLLHNTFDGTAYNGATPLECVVYDYYPADYELQFLSSEGLTHTYSLQEEDKASDGKYYVWKSAVDLVINDYSFPDSELRTYVSDNFDLDRDGYLSDAEIESATQIITYNDISSFDGIQYLTNLEVINCMNLSSPTSIEVRPLKKLDTLLLSGAPLTHIELYNCTELKKLDLSHSKFTYLDLNSNTKLEELTLIAVPITQLNIEACHNLWTIEVSGTKLSHLDISGQASVLESLSCGNTNISYLNLSQCRNLNTLNVSGCRLYALDLSNTQVTSDTIYAQDNRYAVGGFAEGDFSLSYLGDINLENVSNVVGADYDNTTGILSNRTSNEVTYSYDCGNNVTVEFTLVFSY